MSLIVRRCATNEALPTTTVFASSCQGSLVLGELVALLLRLDVPSLEQWTWAAGVARTREYGQFHACRPGMLCRSGHHRYHCRSNNLGQFRSSLASAPHHWHGTGHVYGACLYRHLCERVNSRTKSRERMRAGHVSCQGGRAGPPASLSSGVG